MLCVLGVVSWICGKNDLRERESLGGGESWLRIHFLKILHTFDFDVYGFEVLYCLKGSI